MSLISTSHYIKSLENSKINAVSISDTPSFEKQISTKEIKKTNSRSSIEFHTS